MAKKITDRILSEVMSELGKAGGKAAAKKLTAKQKRERALKAVQAREAKRKGKK